MSRESPDTASETSLPTGRPLAGMSRLAVMLEQALRQKEKAEEDKDTSTTAAANVIVKASNDIFPVHHLLNHRILGSNVSL